MQPPERTYLDCQCDHPGHVVRFTYDPDDGDLYIQARMSNYLPWYKRIWVGLKFVFGISDQHYAEVLVKKTDYNMLLNIIHKAQKNIKDQILNHDFTK